MNHIDTTPLSEKERQDLNRAWNRIDTLCVVTIITLLAVGFLTGCGGGADDQQAAGSCNPPPGFMGPVQCDAKAASAP